MNRTKATSFKNYKIIDGGVEDENYNFALIESWGSLERAVASLKTLEGCGNCINCVNCVNCNGCIKCCRCSGCQNCLGCENCQECVRCGNCKHLRSETGEYKKIGMPSLGWGL